MKTTCSANMPFVQEAFSTLGDVHVRDGRAITAADVRDAELLAIRSTTRVTPELLADSRVRFVGSGTIGTDHMDIPYMEQQGIHWCYSPGCNANSVSEYFVAALLHLGQKHGFTLRGLTVAVIGVGNVGRRVCEKAEALGMKVLQNDPPRAREEGADGFTELRHALSQADVVTMHVPLTRSGEDATVGMVDAAFFGAMRPGAIFMNAARGAIVQSEALLAAMDSGGVAHAVLDTWEDEPACRPEVLARVDLATPHIAGYSYEGRVNGTIMVYREACNFLGVEPSWEPTLPPADSPVVMVEPADAQTMLHQAVRSVYDITADDTRMRAQCRGDAEARAAAFDAMRRHYPERREFPAVSVRLPTGPPAEVREGLDALGFAP